MALEALIFDVDGTLADTEEVHRRAFNAAFAEAGTDWVWEPELYRELLEVEGGLRRIRAWVERARPRDLAWLEHEGRLEAIHARKSDIYLGMVEDGAAGLRPGVARLIQEARGAGLKLGVCTTSSTRAFEGLILSSLGFEALEWFSVIVTGEEVAETKPSRRPYELTLERLGVAAETAVAIEDGGRGVAAAAAAGVRAVATPGTYTAGEDVGDAMIAVTDLGEPGAPFEVIAGDPMGHAMVSTEALEAWLAAADRAPRAA